MKIHDETTPLSERRVVRRGLIAGLAGLGAAAMMKLTGTQTAEAALTALTYPGGTGDVATHTAANITTWQSLAAGGSGYTVLKVENFRIADAIEAKGGPGSLGNSGGQGLTATGGNNSAGTFVTPSTGGDAIQATGGTTTGGVGNGGRGVRGTGGAAGSGIGGTGVEGIGGAPTGVGVRGLGGGTGGAQGNGVFGSTNGTVAGVQGSNSGSGPGVRGDSSSGKGVYGQSTSSDGVHGHSASGVGLRGTSGNFVGLIGISDNSIGMYGYNAAVGTPAFYAENLGPSNRIAGFFNGDVTVQGNFVVSGGNKNAAVTMPDGSEALVYCQESPEPYFEDFGRARLVNGVARVNLEQEFASIVKRDDYMVFPVAEGDCNGLFVSKRDPQGFEVRELKGGSGNLPFT